MIDFTGQVAVVTGAGRGLGRLYALELARRGAAVVVNDIGGSMQGEGQDASVADQVVAEIEAAGGTAAASHDSVDSPEGGQAIVDAALARFGRLDVVVSNAGIYGTAAFHDLTPMEWQRMLSVHLGGSFFLCQPAYRAMMAQGYGRFVLISSSIGAFGAEGESHYAAAKAGIIGLSNAIAIEGAAHGIRSNTVLPFGLSRMVFETVGDQEATPEQQAFYDAIQPELVVPMVVFLASRECELTHQNYSAGAGRYARAFMGLGRGWMAAPGSSPTADDVAAHVEAIAAPEPFYVPDSIVDEVIELMTRRHELAGG
jgi:NAD(P)-dependent dehydrogenase (short-subunit alcohol dehydrogenase family)